MFRGRIKLEESPLKIVQMEGEIGKDLLSEVIPKRYGEMIIVRSSHRMGPTDFRTPVPQYIRVYRREDLNAPVAMSLGRKASAFLEAVFWAPEPKSLRELNEIIRENTLFYFPDCLARCRDLASQFVSYGAMVEAGDKICFNPGFLFGNFLDFGPDVCPYKSIERL
jgi:hypothetical protein